MMMHGIGSELDWMSDDMYDAWYDDLSQRRASDTRMSRQQLMDDALRFREKRFEELRGQTAILGEGFRGLYHNIEKEPGFGFFNKF